MCGTSFGAVTTPSRLNSERSAFALEVMLWTHTTAMAAARHTSSRYVVLFGQRPNRLLHPRLGFQLDFFQSLKSVLKAPLQFARHPAIGRIHGLILTARQIHFDKLESHQRNSIALKTGCGSLICRMFPTFLRRYSRASRNLGCFKSSKFSAAAAARAIAPRRALGPKSHLAV